MALYVVDTLVVEHSRDVSDLRMRRIGKETSAAESSHVESLARGLVTGLLFRAGVLTMDLHRWRRITIGDAESVENVLYVFFVSNCDIFFFVEYDLQGNALNWIAY